jgi:DNA end-binding protein Ku
MHYPNEIRQTMEHGSTDKPEIKEKEKALAMRLIKTLAAHFKPEKYYDTYQQNLQTVIEAKTRDQKLPVLSVTFHGFRLST